MAGVKKKERKRRPINPVAPRPKLTLLLLLRLGLSRNACSSRQVEKKRNRGSEEKKMNKKKKKSMLLVVLLLNRVDEEQSHVS